MKKYGVGGQEVPPFLTSALGGSGQLHAPDTLPPGERAPGINQIGD
jgi:hypothetical protein